MPHCPRARLPRDSFVNASEQCIYSSVLYIACSLQTAHHQAQCCTEALSFQQGFCCPELLVQLLASGALGSTLGLRLANRGLLDFEGRQFLIEFLQPPPPPLFPFFQVATLRRIIRLS